MGDQEAALVNDQGRRRVAATQKLAQYIIESLDIFLEKLWQGGHIIFALSPQSPLTRFGSIGVRGVFGGRGPIRYAFCGTFWLMNLLINTRVIMLSDSKTPSHLWPTELKDGTCTSRLLRRNSMYSTGAALGRSRLLYCKTYGISSRLSLRLLRLSARFWKLSTFSFIFSYCESETNTMPSTPRS